MHRLEVDSVQLAVAGKSLISDLYLSCSTGEVIGIYGRNGCGKSALFKSIFGVHTPQQLYVGIDGKRVEHSYLHTGQIGYLPQFQFMPLHLSIKTLFDDYGCDEDRFIDCFPGEFSKQTRKLSRLSAGQVRLIELYLIITGRYKFVLLDEPFTFISPVYVQKLQQVILEERATKGILITDHQHHYVRHIANRNYMLQNGALHNIDG